ncbi:MAG: TonB-dependent receptor [Tannerella sp.]|nr:TonB-dependent receptor [Tannerella sp.]
MKKKMIFLFRGGTWRKTLLMLCILISCSLSLMAQKRVSGTVTDVASGEAIVGANVVVKGTTNGTSTDADGKFAINVGDNAILQISYMGYVSQEIKVGSQSVLTVMLREDTQLLEEVVVVGYGTQKKVNLTGAVASVKGETLENRSVANISQALQGQVANLNITSASGGAPGSAPSINIRGYTGFGSAAAPLVVIDGIQGGDLNSINMNDVENISVLKDAASAAIYGSSAPYGVILITTKRGKAGQKPTISYNNNFGWAQTINVPQYMTSVENANFFNEAARNSGINQIYSDEVIGRMQEYLDGKRTTETELDPRPEVDGWLTGNGNNDWFKIFLKDASFNQQHNIGVSGSAGKAGYYVGMGYLQQLGLIRFGEDSYQRYNLRANLSTELTNWLSFSFRGAFSRGQTDSPNNYTDNYGTLMHALGRMAPHSVNVYPNGERLGLINVYQNAGRVLQTNDNAVLTGEFIIKPLSGWDITANYTFDGFYINGSSHNKTVYSITPKLGVKSALTPTPNSFSRSYNRNLHNTFNAYTSYEKQLSDHYFKAMVGFTQELYDNLSMSGSNSYLYSDELPALSLTYGTSPSLSDGASQLAIRGGFGRINYNYKEKYLFEFDGRYDGTSKFMKDSRYKFYPGVSAAWVMSKEEFWQPLEQSVNLLKIRGEYGSLGDQGFTSSYYPFYPSLGTSRPTSSNFLFSGGRESAINQPSLVNTSLSWVTTTSIDFGLDLAFLSNRLNISFDWYRRFMDDYVGPAEAMPAFLGTSAPQTNSAAMETKGWDLTLGWRDQAGDFSYGIDAVLSDYRSYVTKYPNPNGLISTWYVGQEIGSFWGYETYGLFQSEQEIESAPSQSLLYSRWTPGDVRYKDLNGDGKIDWGDGTLSNPGDKKIIGNTTPRWNYGVTLSAQYKGFDMTLFLQGVGKRETAVSDYSHVTNYYWGITGDQWQSMGFVEQRDRWSESNPDGFFPKYYMTRNEMIKNTYTQTRYLLNSAYMRIKYMQLGYNLPASLTDKISVQKIRLFVNVENLATLTKMPRVMDPEVSNTGGWYGVDGKIYPLQRNWACGINVTF